MNRQTVGLWVLISLAGCATMPIGSRVELTRPIGAEDLERVTLVLHNLGYVVESSVLQPRLEIVGGWSPFQRLDAPGWKRVRLVQESPTALSLWVEVRFLLLDLFARPFFTAVEPDVELELELAAGLRQAQL